MATTTSCALVWNQPVGELKQLPNLRLVFSLGVGVEHILRDPGYPRHVALIRVINDGLTRQMCI